MTEMIESKRDKCEKAAVYLVIAACFVVPFSTALTNVATILAILFWICSGKVLSFPRLVVTNHLLFLSVTLFLLLVVGLFYTPAPFQDAILFLKKYRELLLFPIVFSLIAYKGKSARIAENCFFLGCIFLMIVSYGIYFSLIPSNRYGYSIVYHITHSYVMATLAFWCLQRMFSSKKYLILWILLFACASVNLFYITPGRTGMLGYILLVLLSCYQHLPLKKSLPATLIFAILIGLAFTTSENFSNRFHEAVQEIQSYQPESGGSRTSLGQRFDWWHNSIDLIKQAPYLGHGTGSFKTEQAKLIKGTNTKATDNPHNEFLLISVQSGLIGGFLFVSLLGALFIHSFRLPPPRRYLLQGVVLAMSYGCLLNSLLFDSLPGQYFALLCAILSTPQEEAESKPEEEGCVPA